MSLSVCRRGADETRSIRFRNRRFLRALRTSNTFRVYMDSTPTLFSKRLHGGIFDARAVPFYGRFKPLHYRRAVYDRVAFVVQYYVSVTVCFFFL